MLLRLLICIALLFVLIPYTSNSLSIRPDYLLSKNCVSAEAVTGYSRSGMSAPSALVSINVYSYGYVGPKLVYDG